MTFSSSNKALLAGVSGTALQWYDFVIFGYIGDRFGRKRALMFSIMSMAVSTALISLVPGYKFIGIATPVLITSLRVIQGFVTSAEFTGSAIFLVEHADPGKKAFYGCLTRSAYIFGMILAGLSASLFTASFMPEWGWRLGFLVAIIAGILIFYVRSKVEESPEYLQLKQKEKPQNPFVIAVKEVPLVLVGVIGIAWLVSIMTFGTYVFGTVVGLVSLVLCEKGRRKIEGKEAAIYFYEGSDNVAF